MSEMAGVHESGITLPEHERHSAERAKRIEKKIKHLKKDMKMSNVTGPEIFSNGLGGMGGFGGGNFGAPFAGGLTGAIVGNLFRRGFGDGEGGVEGGAETRIQDNAANLAILGKLGNIEAAVPFNALQTQATLGAEIARFALGTQQGFADVKDSVQVGVAGLASSLADVKDTVVNTGIVNLQATNQVGKEVIAAIGILSSKIDANTIANLQNELAEERARGRAAGTEVNVSQVVNQVQAQAQAQSQAQQQTLLLSQLVNGFGGIANQLNNVHQGIVQIGAGNSAIPTTTNTNVR